MQALKISYKRHRFPPHIIAHVGWLYIRFNLSLREVEEIGPVALLCRSKCSFKPLPVRKRRGFSNPVLSDSGVDCRTC